MAGGELTLHGKQRRYGRGFRPARAARSMLFSREFESSPWSSWDDPARLVVTLSTERYRREAELERS